MKFTLPERLLWAVKRGQEVSVVSADAASADKHAAKIIDVSPVVDPSSGTIEVMAQIEGSPPTCGQGCLPPSASTAAMKLGKALYAAESIRILRPGAGDPGAGHPA